MQIFFYWYMCCMINISFVLSGARGFSPKLTKLGCKYIAIIWNGSSVCWYRDGCSKPIWTKVTVCQAFVGKSMSSWDVAH